MQASTPWSILTFHFLWPDGNVLYTLIAALSCTTISIQNVIMLAFLYSSQNVALSKATKLALNAIVAPNGKSTQQLTDSIQHTYAV